eukprot:3776911-Pleurochrysis_carterae.AAC.1
MWKQGCCSRLGRHQKRFNFKSSYEKDALLRQMTLEVYPNTCVTSQGHHNTALNSARSSTYGNSKVNTPSRATKRA